MHSPKNITKFWNWFEQNLDNIQSMLSSNEFNHDFEHSLRKIGISAWELGPDTENEGGLFFAIPMTSSTERNELVTKIIEVSPIVKGWVFLAGRPKKHWNRTLLWGKNKREINADAWFFEVRKYTDGLHDLLLFTENGIADTEAEAENIVYEVLCSELGEKLVWDTVYAVSTKVAEKTNEENHLHHIGDLEELLKKSHATKTVN